ncbi:protein unc-93 homolog A-like [Haliotis rufescens]|uniref:protein unc-93 homolog A-like n=1 Tax=Haliotis rufescens TaxID=6454 RepID=UPI001EAFC0C5|nr:protein unc-93 homolog A-like [Haliotis rufescens]
MSTEKKKDTPPSYTEAMELPEKNVENKDPAAQLTAKFTKMKVIKNLLVVSVGFLFLFTAFQSMSNLQTSLNMKSGVGSGSLSILYGALVLSCLFVPPFMIAHLGCKWTIPLSMLGYILYMGANFYPVWGLMAPAAVILGLGAAPLWSAKCTYLTQTGVWYAKMTGQTEDAVINAFFGVFFMIFQTSQVWGNLISSTIFKEDDNHNATNKTFDELSKCGANFFPADTNVTDNTNLERPVTQKVYIVCGIYTGFAVLAAVTIIFFLDRIKLDKDDNKTSKKVSPRLLISTFKHLIKSPYQQLLIPLTIYSGVEQAFITGDFTRSYITCSMGISNVGYIMICYGVVDALCSFTFGRLVQYVGHIPFFILAFLVHGGCQIALLLWMPNPDTVVVYYIIAACWGMGDAVIQTQINAFYGYLFTENTEAAFANYRLWESVGFIITYAYNDFLFTYIKLYVCIGVMCVGMAGYATTEMLVRRKRSESRDLQNN